ncbi:MAG TPA: hypothetical protein VLA00_16405 [Xanthobacteraceae bacterium]|nr:hypothetical protein [Xanthobacteraceae bacterium]
MNAMHSANPPPRSPAKRFAATLAAAKAAAIANPDLGLTVGARLAQKFGPTGSASAGEMLAAAVASAPPSDEGAGAEDIADVVGCFIETLDSDMQDIQNLADVFSCVDFDDLDNPEAIVTAFQALARRAHNLREYVGCRAVVILNLVGSA